MLVLGVESSCDETAVALVSFDAAGQPQLVKEVVASQIELHGNYGGVVPELASREHLRSFPLLLEQLFHGLERSRPHEVTLSSDTGSVSQPSFSEVTHIAVTAGPGLKGCLLIGVGVARALAMAHDLPLIPVNHIEGHVLSALLTDRSLTFPFLALVVSGGHTELIRVEDVGRYELISRTIDDAAGEAFDKSANLLGLAYPGGPQLSKLARSADPELQRSYLAQLPKVMRESSGFSFSGLKTAIATLVRRHHEEIEGSDAHRAALAAAVQDSIVEAICFKTGQALDDTALSTVVLTGGVAANEVLRERLKTVRKNIRVVVPPAAHCTDNAAMIANVGGLRALRGEQGTYSPQIHSRWPIEALPRCGEQALRERSIS